MKKKEVLLVNALPLNNGDAALVFSSYEYFINAGFNVSIASQKYNTVRQVYPEIEWVKDINDIAFLRKIPFFKIFLTPFLFLFNKDYIKADLIVGVPGGYLNSYYGIISTLMPFLIAKLLRKQTMLLPQSFGPIRGKDIIIFKFFKRFIDVIISRDNFSTQQLLMLGISAGEAYQMPDVAFLTASPSDKSKEKIAAISVRGWAYDSRDGKKYDELIIQLINQLISNGYKIEFLSTCQGLSDYVNDSLVAKSIFNQLNSEQQMMVIVNESYYKYEDFSSYIEKFDIVIGTRLHMCILSLGKGIPAFNISYEKKGIECYQYMGIPELSIDYNNEIKDALSKFDNFLVNKENYKHKIRVQVLKLKTDIVNGLNEVIETINN